MEKKRVELVVVFLEIVKIWEKEEAAKSSAFDQYARSAGGRRQREKSERGRRRGRESNEKGNGRGGKCRRMLLEEGGEGGEGRRGRGTRRKIKIDSQKKMYVQREEDSRFTERRINLKTDDRPGPMMATKYATCRQASTLLNADAIFFCLSSWLLPAVSFSFWISGTT